jgi:hypothetical protein
MHGEMRYFNILDGCFNVIIGGTLINSACQVHNRDIWCWNSEGHASELAGQLRKDFPNRLTLKQTSQLKTHILEEILYVLHLSYLCCTSGARNYVLASTMSTSLQSFMEGPSTIFCVAAK